MSTVVGPVADGMCTGATLELRLPATTGDPAQVQQLAAAYERFADEVAAWVGQAGRRLSELSPVWRGRAALSCGEAAARLEALGSQVERALRHCARELDDYANKLEAAQQHHGWSLTKLLTLGGIVVVTGGALVVTLGGAAAVAGTVEAAEATTAAEGASVAARAAEAAGDEAAAGLLEGSRAMSELRDMTRFLLPHLRSGAINGGLSAFVDELHRGRIGWTDVADSAVAGLGGSFLSTQTGLMLADHWESAATMVRRVGPYAAQAGLGAAATAGQQLSEDQPVTVPELVVGAAEGVGGTAVGKLREIGLPIPIHTR